MHAILFQFSSYYFTYLTVQDACFLNAVQFFSQITSAVNVFFHDAVLGFYRRYTRLLTLPNLSVFRTNKLCLTGINVEGQSLEDGGWLGTCHCDHFSM